MKKKLLYSIVMLLFVTGTMNAFVKEQIAPIERVEATTKTENLKTNYTVTLKVKTNGVESDIGGKLISTNGVLSGVHGTKVSLKPTAHAGYRFVGYQSFLASGNSTDGLLPIENDSFDISDKTGSVTVYALFETIPIDLNVYFSDDFSNDSLSNYQISSNLTGRVAVTDGRLNIHAPGVSSIVPVLSRAIEENVATGYEVTFNLQQIGDVKAWNTFRVVFKENADGSVHALELTGKTAIVRRLTSISAPNQAGDKYAESSLNLGSELHNIKITVKGDIVSVTDNATPIVSYTSPNAWGGASAKVAFTPISNRSVALDDIVIKKTRTLRTVRVVTRLDGRAVTDIQPGVIKGIDNQVFVNDPLNMSVIAKIGYDFKSFKDETGKVLDLSTYRVPTGSEELVLYADFTTAKAVDREAKTFYIDSRAGNDRSNGESAATAWKTLGKLRDITLVPGDRVLIKRGSRFVGAASALNFKGSGTVTAPIVISTYGEGERPLLEAQGEVGNVVRLYNQEYITIESLAVTNLDPKFNMSFELNGNNNRSKSLRGVHVVAEDFGVVHGITIRDMHIHDINGSLSSKWNGGIFFDAGGSTVPTKYDGVLIENNYVERVDRSGIKLVGSTWANQNLKNNKNLPLNWYPSTNVVLRGNRIEKAGGDSITVRDTDGALVEYNISADARYQDTGYNAGIWPFQASNTVLQYNEAFRTHGVTDGQGLDLDHVANNSVMQYNYSHDNEGGFMLIMNWYEQTSPTVRYNISQNDKDKTFEFARGGAAGTAIYNNTIYSDSKLMGRSGVIDMPGASSGTGVKDIFFFNNIFYYANGEKMFVEASDAPKYKDKIHFYNNAYIGVEVPESDSKAITEGVALNAKGTGPTDNKTMIANAGKYLTGQLDGYKLPENSLLATKGVTKDDAITYFYKKLGVSQQVDFLEKGSATMSPTAAFDLNRTTNSVDAIARKYPVITGVTYDKDFFGAHLQADVVSVGAAQGEMKPTEVAPTRQLRDLKTGVSVILAGQDAKNVAAVTVAPVSLQNLPASSSLHETHNLYEIDLFNAAGGKVKLEGKATVRMPIQNGKEVGKVVYVVATGDTYKEELLNYRVEEGYAHFEVNHFSKYGVVYSATGSTEALKNSSTSSLMSAGGSGVSTAAKTFGGASTKKISGQTTDTTVNASTSNGILPDTGSANMLLAPGMTTVSIVSVVGTVLLVFGIKSLLKK